MKYHIFAFSILFLFACNNIPGSKKQGIEIHSVPNLGNFISEYTPKEISVKEAITVRFSGSVVEADLVGEQISNKTVRMEPNVQGSAYWEDMSTLVYKPDEDLEYNSDYHLLIQLSSFYDNVVDSLSLIKIPYHTSDLSFHISFDQIDYGLSSQNDMIILSGSIQCSDFVDQQVVTDMLFAKQKGNDEINVNWLSHKNNYHSFEISNIKRLGESSSVEVEWDGGKFNAFKGNRHFPIQPKGIFSLVEAEVLKTGEQGIRLSFSEKINKNQDLNGMIRIKDYQGSFRFDISGANITLYPQQSVQNDFILEVDKQVSSSSNSKLQSNHTYNLSFEPVKPLVRLSGKGVITPHTDQIFFPFEAQNLLSVKVEIFKIFENNVLQFLQYNRLNDEYGLYPVGKVIHQEEIDLAELSSENNQAGFVRYVLDLANFVSADPGAIYQVRIGFDQEDVAHYKCENENEKVKLVFNRDGFTSIFEQDHYNYRERDNPCHRAYYNSNRFISRNVLASNLGVIAKRDKNQGTQIIVTHLKSLQAIEDVSIFFF